MEFPKDDNEVLQYNLIESKSDIAYLTELFQKFNESNLQLQGDDLNLIKTKSVVSALAKKLILYKQNFQQGKFSNYPKLSVVEKNDDDIQSYCDHLETLNSDFIQRFGDILKMKIHDWIFDLFLITNTEESPKIQEEFFELIQMVNLNLNSISGTNNFGCKRRFQSLIQKYGLLFKNF